mgnify:CR=1 FL=1
MSAQGVAVEALTQLICWAIAAGSRAAHQPTQRVEAEARILNHHWPADLACCQLALLLRYLFGLTLQLWKIELLADNCDRQ